MREIWGERFGERGEIGDGREVNMLKERRFLFRASFPSFSFFPSFFPRLFLSLAFFPRALTCNITFQCFFFVFIS